MAGISSLGVGSGVLNNDLVDKLVEAERAPATKRLDRDQKVAEAKISAFGKLRSAVTELRLPLRQLSSPDNLKSFSATSSNTDVSVSVDSAKASRGSYSIQVDSLAQAQSLASGSFADKDSTAVGDGSLTLSVGGESKSITIDNSNNTLQGIANAINDAGLDATAGVIDTGNGFRLVLSAEKTGTDNAIYISVNDSDGSNSDTVGLSRLSFDGTNNNLTQTVAPQDAVVQINGIEITRSTNKFENVVDGLTFEAKSQGAVSTVKVEQDTAKVAERVQGFVDKFNALQGTIKALAGYNAETQQGGLLSGDSAVRGIQSQLRDVLTRVVPGLENAGARTLADVGITTDADTGGLKFDSDKFEAALKNNPDDVTAIFAEQGRATDAQVEFVRSGLDTAAGNYDINITQQATRGALQGANAGTGSVTIGDGNDNLTFKINDSINASIQLTAGTYTREELASEIQTQLNNNTALGAADQSVAVDFDSASGALSFTSSRYGSESNISLTSVDTNTATDLGLSVASGTAGQDVVGTIDGRAAKGDGQVLYLESDRGPASGLQVRITGDTLGSRGSINFIEGVGDRTVNLITSLVGSGGALDSRTQGLQRELDGITEDRADLEDRIISYQERLKSQFSSADALISQLNNTQDYLTQQFAALNPQKN